MATSSIFESFTIDDEDTVKNFADALEKAEKQPKWKPSASVKHTLRDPEKIKALMKNGENENDK